MYSHAAVWDGAYVVEATTGGVGKYTLQDEINAQWYVDAYRWQTDPPGNVLGDPSYPSQPVTLEADKIAASGAAYAYSELLMGAFLIWVSKKPDDVKLRILIRLLGDEIERWIVDNILANPQKKGITCTEVVCKSFWDAAPPPPPLHLYQIVIHVDGSRSIRGLANLQLALNTPGTTPANVAQGFKGYDGRAVRLGYRFLQANRGVDALQFTMLASLQSQHAQYASGLGGLGPTVSVGEDVPLFFVSPRELQTSPNLVCLGRLSEKVPPPDPGSLWKEILALLWKIIKRRIKTALSSNSPPAGI